MNGKMNRPSDFSQPVHWVLALGLLAASCAGPGPVRWQKPGATQDQWVQDKAACQSRARKETERRFQETGSEIGSPVYGSGRTLEKNMALYEARRTERRLYEHCLRARGYRKTGAAPARKG